MSCSNLTARERLDVRPGATCAVNPSNGPDRRPGGGLGSDPMAEAAPPLPVRLLLAASGLVAIGVGAALALDPVGFQAAQGIDAKHLAVGHHASALSELRAPGGALVAIGLVALAGAFRASLASAALVAAAAVYLGYGLARLSSLVLDGRPSDELLVALGFELVLGGLCALALLGRARSTPAQR
ncbi:hypothetical protein Pla163_02500 [Planctomycetes bacterium Pla163]|uniref:DUF4345 domain-containing protein n=1 Tax=Rohdeia mirabilis TaxID=2528008 RepID=A0A518CV95_9BACT|nr:hypothetical protein Pla163_02500 [Planctomycetes bacterium Pla163]